MVVVVSLTVGVSVGTTCGLLAGYFGRHIDEIIMRIVDVWAALPFIMLALIVVSIFGQDLRILIALLALISWPGAVRLVRAQTLSLRESDYVQFARVAGASSTRILLRHILPGVINIVVVSATLGVGGIILTEATLSYLAVGIPPPTPAWGAMVANGRENTSATLGGSRPSQGWRSSSSLRPATSSATGCATAGIPTCGSWISRVSAVFLAMKTIRFRQDHATNTSPARQSGTPGRTCETGRLQAARPCR